MAAEFLITIGGILLMGLLTSALGKHTFLPRVTLLLLFGILIGEHALNLIPELFTTHFHLIADMTLVMVAFLLGGRLRAETFRQRGSEIIGISVSAAIMPAILVGVSLWLIEVPLPAAIMLGTIAAATAPAAVLDVVIESRVNNPFSELLLSIVAIDDLWGLILFSIGVAIIWSWQDGGGHSMALLHALREIGGAALLGIGLGYPAALLSGRIKPGEPMLSEALGLVFLCGGLALWLEVSFLIAPIVMGAVIANRARHHDFAFHEIANIEWPFMVIFFVVAGATLELHTLSSIGAVGAAYVVARTAGKMGGAWLGARFAFSPASTRHWIGLALLPHAGVAIGMALVAANYFPQHEQLLLSVVISATVVFELLGPVCARIALRKGSQHEESSPV